jgi:hypothetical protein
MYARKCNRAGLPKAEELVIEAGERFGPRSAMGMGLTRGELYLVKHLLSIIYIDYVSHNSRLLREGSWRTTNWLMRE